METNQLVSGRVRSTLVIFFIPYLLTYLFQNLYGAVDMFVVGRYCSAGAMSAVSTGSQVLNTVLTLSMGFCTGVTVLIGKRVGEKDDKGVAQVILNTVIVLFILSLVLAGSMIFGSRLIVSVLRTPTEAVVDTTRYISICGGGIPFIIGYNLISEIFHGLGDSKTPFVFVLVACFINIVLDFTLVGFFRFGAAGAAAATVFAQAVAFAFGGIYLYKKKKVNFAKENLAFNRQITGVILKTGVPMSLYYVQRSISYLIVITIINTGGVVASAAAGVSESIMGFAIMLPSSVGAALSVMIAHNLGAGDNERVSRALRWGMQLNLIFGIFICLYCQLVPQTLTGIFTKDPQIIRAAALYLRSYSIECILFGLSSCMNAYFVALGKSRICMLHSIIGAFGGRVPMAYIVSKLPGTTLYHLGFSSPTGAAISVIICTGFMVHLRKKNLAGT